MEETLDRIEALNPEINAIVALRPRAELMAEAARCDARASRGWLHGIPFAVKDLEETGGIATAHGSPIWAGNVPREDGAIAARIRAAGAVLIGKTNVPEFGVGSHTYNKVYGTTRNPYDPAKSAGGSSGGAAAALAARMLAVADGSDMMGSLRNPAAFNNVYGFRPTGGLVPPDPDADPLARELSTAGPMGRNPQDLALLLETLSASNPGEGRSYPLESPPETSRPVGWIGDWNGHYPVEPGILDLCESALDTLGKAGRGIERAIPDFDPRELWDAWTILRSRALANSLAEHYGDLAQRALMKPEIAWEVERGLGISAEALRRAKAVRENWRRELDRMLGSFEALALPSAQLFPFNADLDWPGRVCGQKMSTYHQWMEVAVPASLAGAPALAVPAGFGEAGLPTGMQLVGRRGDDLRILRLGQAYHRLTGWPEIDPSSAPERRATGR